MQLLCSLPSTRLKPNFEVLPCPGAFSSLLHTAKALVICEHLPLLSFPAACFPVWQPLCFQPSSFSSPPHPRSQRRAACGWQLSSSFTHIRLEILQDFFSIFFLSLLFFELPPLLLAHFSPSMLDTCTWLMLGEDESLWVLHKWGILFISQRSMYVQASICTFR